MWAIPLSSCAAESSRTGAGIQLIVVPEQTGASFKRADCNACAPMQARIGLQFLLNALAQVKRLYERGPQRATMMLAEVVAYLRAAMRRIRMVG
jgi:LytS/YehU family sensor histidine kinase